MTELEGAILIEITASKNETAFQIRRSFEQSLSSEWSGSAGAVYPAIRRLVAAGYLTASAVKDKRGTRVLSLTARGLAAHQAWMRDTEAATNIGADSFRLRARLWADLPARDRIAFAETLSEELRKSIKSLESFDSKGDPAGQIGVDLAIELQKARLRWVTRHLSVS